MKKIITVLLVLTLIGSLTGCGTKTGAGKTPDKTIVVGASSTPHAQILEAAKPEIEKAGYELKIVEYTDYVQPNVALESEDLDANYFQHQPYLDQYNQENKTKIVSAGTVHYEPMGIYAGKTASIDALADGAKIAVPNDATNEARALLLLEANGIIKLKKDAGINATKNDIAENPKNVELIEIEAAQVARSLQDVDLAVINGNYAIQAKLNVATDAIAVEAVDSLAADTYANIVAVKSGNENRADIKVLMDALHSDTVKKYIEDTYKGAVVPKF